MSWLRNGSRWLCAGLVLCLAPRSAQAQNPTLTILQNMDYGEVVVTAGGGTIVMNASSGAITSTTGGVSNTSAFTTFNGTLQASGRAGRTFFIYTTVGSFTMTGPGGGSFAVNTGPITSDLPGDSGKFPNPPPTTTSKIFHTGGTISLPFGLPTGTYSGFLPLFVQDSNGNNSNTVNLPVTIRIQIPIALTKTADLDFGTIIPGATAGTVTLVPGTGVESFGGGVLYSAATGQPALFAITGAPNHAFSIAATPSPLTLNGSLGGTMSLALNTDLGTSGTLNGTGGGTVKVGGTLSVGATQAEGDYTGNFQLTVSYP